MKDKLRCAVIGAGNMGSKHIKAFSELEDVVFVAICEKDEKKGKEIAEKYKTSFYKNYLEMIEKEDIDVVSICVPTSLHHEIGKGCIVKGLDVLLEKPISDKIENAEELLMLAKTSSINLLVGHIERFNPAVVRLKKIIDDGKIGEIISVSSRRFGCPPVNTEDNNVAIDLAIHDIDIINFLLNDLPFEVFVKKSENSSMKREVSVEFFLKYKNSLVNIQAGWTTLKKIRELDIIGTKGSLMLNYISQKITFKSNSFSSKESLDLDVERKEPLKEEILYFLDLVRKDKKISSEFALEALKIAVQNYEESIIG